MNEIGITQNCACCGETFFCTDGDYFCFRCYDIAEQEDEV